MIRYFDCLEGLGWGDSLVGKGCDWAVIPRPHSLIKYEEEEKTCGNTRPNSAPILSRGGKTCQSCYSADRRTIPVLGQTQRELWVEHRSNQDSTPAVGLFICRRARDLGQISGWPDSVRRYESCMATRMDLSIRSVLETQHCLMSNMIQHRP
jgi:hypothetical protein